MRRLVVPTDFSDFAQEALRFAVAIRRRTGAEVHLLHVESLTPLAPSELGGAEGPFGGGTHARSTNEDGLRAALRQQAEIAGTTLSDLTSATRTAYAVAPEVLTYAAEVGADTIVAGTHGRRGFRRMILGSVAEELVRTSPIDVLITPLKTVPFSARPARRLLVPVDLNKGSEALLEYAHSLAQLLSPDRVDLLHVVEPLPYPVGWLDEAILDIVPTIRDRAMDSLREMASGAGLTPKGVYVERGKPARVIGRVAEARDSDLLILAPHEQGRIERALLGSVASEVARTCERPVLVARSLFHAPEAEPLPDASGVDESVSA